MATTLYIEILWGIACSLFVFHWIVSRHAAVINWPIIGMLPALVWNQRRLHEHISNVLKQSGGTFHFRGPWFTNHDFVVTSDPINIQHMLSKRFSNYPNGPKFTMTFEPLLGDGIIAADSDMWKFQRKIVHSYLHHANFLQFLEKTIQQKVVKCLIPVLDHAGVHETEVNLDDVFLRLGFDLSCMLFLGCDPKCLSVESPQDPYLKAINDMEEALMHRNIVPDKCWRLLKWLQIGHEKKLSSSSKILDGFIYECISSKRVNFQSLHVSAYVRFSPGIQYHEPLKVERCSSTTFIPNKDAIPPPFFRSSKIPDEGTVLHDIGQMEEFKPDLDFLTFYLMQEETIKKAAPVIKSSNKFIRHMVTNLVVAGRDTSSTALSWFFWLLAMNPTVETKILEEITENLQLKDGTRSQIFGANELDQLVYLHAALCETLRLYPSVPLNTRCPVLRDTLPSGLYVNQDTNILISFYAMGRMEEIWGKDCHEFKPERWISGEGRIIHVPSYKFTAFGAGPRSCVGKDTSFVQMKIVAAAIIFKYRVHVVEDNLVIPSTSLVLHMKHGLKVRITNRMK